MEGNGLFSIRRGRSVVWRSGSRVDGVAAVAATGHIMEAYRASMGARRYEFTCLGIRHTICMIAAL